MSDRQKKRLFEKQAEVAKAIAHPLRIAILDFLKGKEQCVCDIAKHIGSEQSNVPAGAMSECTTMPVRLSRASCPGNPCTST